jgi:dUTP pyrophosphatase|nr:MAG TPA: deoxyuridine 5'-triphosphate nucleotidohydrolase [Caudoviricetes sp.]
MNVEPNSKKVVEEVREALSQLNNLDGNSIDAIAVLLSMDDAQFELVSPGILDSFLRSLNTTNARLMLAQSINATGSTAESVQNEFLQLVNEVDTITDLTAPKRDFLKKLLRGINTAISETEGIAKRYIQIPFVKCHPNAKMPEYAHPDDSGMDVYAVDDYVIHPGETKLIPTGIKVAVPNGYEIQIRSKSGRALKTKMRIANSIGTVDAGFRGELQVIIENIEPPIKDITYDFDDNGRPIITSILRGSDMTIGKGEKFAQLVLMEVPKAVLFQVENLDDTERGNGGFGSTNLK